MNAVQLSFDQALKQRTLGLDQLEGHYPRWLDRARAVAEEICRRRGTVTADDVREVLSIPVGVHHNVVGAIFKGPRWERVEWRQSEQRQGHGRWIGVWRLREDGRDGDEQ